MNIDINQLKQLIQQDPRVSHEDKNALLEFLYQPDALSLLLGGAGGYALSRSIMSFMSLDKTSQILLSLAGFGIGAIIVKTLGQDQSHLVDYQAGRGYKVHTGQK